MVAKSGFRGVRKVHDRFQARIRVHDERINLGYYDTAEEAARAYDAAARERLGEYALVNFYDDSVFTRDYGSGSNQSQG
jgi:hypothetical protein